MKTSTSHLVVVSGNGSVWSNQFDLEFAYKDHSNRMVIEAITGSKHYSSLPYSGY